MAKRIVWQLADGSILVTSPMEDPKDGETEQQFLDRIAARARECDPRLASAGRLPDVDHTALPPRRFRGCWKHNGSSLGIDMPSAKAQRLVEIRAERDKRLAASDALKAKLDDVGTAPEKAALATYRQSLRNIPQTIQGQLNAAATPEDLLALEPNWPVSP